VFRKILYQRPEIVKIYNGPIKSDREKSGDEA
jgi:hypothetical protein